MPAEQPLPDYGDNRRRNDDLRKARQALLPDFAARNAQFDQRAHSGNAARNHLAVIEVGDARKPCTFGDDKSDDVATPRRYHFLREGLGKTLKRGTNRTAWRRRRGKTADQRHQCCPYQFLKQRLLVLEVQIDRAFGDAGAAGDVVEPRRGVPARDEFIHRRIDDGLATLRGACRPVGWMFGRRAPRQSRLWRLGRGSLLPEPAIGRFRGGTFRCCCPGS